MIEFKNLKSEQPFKLLKMFYDSAIRANQKNIEAICISSFNKNNQQVDSRFVNLKTIKIDEFIFFSNYDSPKAKAFETHDQISATLYWSSINVQIRIKAKIKKTSKTFNQKYFKSRSKDKNALAISSKQSNKISSFDEVSQGYEKTKLCQDLQKCPEYWGGFSFKPYEIEFWQGHEFRLNKRDLFQKKHNNWVHSILEP